MRIPVLGVLSCRRNPLIELDLDPRQGGRNIFVWAHIHPCDKGVSLSSRSVSESSDTSASAVATAITGLKPISESPTYCLRLDETSAGRVIFAAPLLGNCPHKVSLPIFRS